MKNKTEKLWNLGMNNAKFFKHLAEDMVVDVENDEEKLLASFVTASIMAMGAESKRTSFMMTGAAIGVAGTIITLKIREKFKKKEVVVNLGELVEVMEPILKKDLEEHNNKGI